MNVFALKVDSNILHAQAFGTWLYLQFGEYGLFFGTGCPVGVRLVWAGLIPRIRLVRHGMRRKRVA